MEWEDLMLQDLYDNEFGFAGLLWGEIWVFLFREETGLMEIWGWVWNYEFGVYLLSFF